MMWPGTARLPRPRWGLAMTRQGGAAVHQRSDTVQLACARRSLSAATDAIGRFVFTGSRYESAVPSRDCRVGLRPPRNDKPLAFTVLSTACSERQHCAGPGCPLPYRVCTVGESAQKFAADNGSAIAALLFRSPGIKNNLCLTAKVIFGTPEGTRTPDLLVRSQSLYPAELPARTHSTCSNILPQRPTNCKHFFRKSREIFRSPFGA